MLLGNYRLQTQLSAGRDGVSYRAEVESTGEPVEVRVLGAARADAPRWATCVRRLLLATLVEHPAVQRVLKCALDSDPPFVALEWIEAPTLADALGPQLPLPAGETAVLAAQLADALAAAHRLGAAHGNLNPSTVRLRTGRRAVIDLTGLETAALPGEPSPIDRACRAPEAQPDSAGDLFALGTVLAWLIHGAGFVANLSKEQAWQRLAATSADGDPVAGDSLEQLIQDLRASDPADRPTALRVVERLQGLRSTPPVPAAVTGLAATGMLPSPFIDADADQNFFVAAPGATEEDVLRRGQLGRFRLLEKLGQGGMGAVFKAEDLADHSLVAIKVLRRDWDRDGDALRRFHKEARLLAEVNNPYVANLLEMNEDAGIHFLAIEFVAGQSLARVLKERERFDESTALAIIADVCRALVDAHRHGIVHRDVKPDNILIGCRPSAIGDRPESPATPQPIADSRQPMAVKLSDFGLARHVIESESLRVTQAGSILGTPLYMPPEQCRGEAVDPRADVYSLGATLFHLLAGRPPFLADTPLAVINMHCKEPPPALKKLVPELSEGVCRIVEKALAKAPEARHGNAAALLYDLERLLKGEPTSIVVHPKLPACDPKRVLHYDWILELQATPEQLWPHVSNTERFNRAAGVSSRAIRAASERRNRSGTTSMAISGCI